MRRWIQRISCIFLALLLLTLLAGFTYEQVGRATDASQLPPRVGQAVDIGGRTLNLYCSGQGSPTVILEPGGNSPGYSWLLQQSKMAAFTRTCWYDRAGVGWSDPPSSPRTSASMDRATRTRARGSGWSVPARQPSARVRSSWAAA